MRNIHAISLNTAIDIRIRIPQFTLGAIIRSEGYREYLAGKAVNNSRAIASLGGEVGLYCFSGANEVHSFSSISPQIKAHVIACEGVTRKNITLVNKNAELICHVQNQGYHVTESNLNELEKALYPSINEGDVIVVSGSIPIGTPPDYLDKLVRLISERKGIILLDVDPPLLSKIDCKNVRLVKPNLEELSRLAGRNLVNIDEIVTTASNLIKSNIVVVSLGQNGALWIDREKRHYVQAKTNLHEQGDLDVIGCGDAMVGAFALGIAQNKTSLEILKMGICSGYAKMFVEGPGIISLDHYHRASDFVEFGNEQQF
jgi:1-phosphofructokinase family hexose kinase